MLSGLWSFLSLLPQLFSIYNNAVAAVGKENAAQFLADLDESTDLAVRSKDLSIPVDQRRKMRQDALDKGRDLWGRITG